MKIYTKTGDKGTTSLFDGTRVLKNNIRVETYAAIDELNSVLGMVVSTIKKIKEKNKTEKVLSELIEIQKNLFEIGSVLANPSEKPAEEFVRRLTKRVLEFEQFIDSMTHMLPELSNFILPGGSFAGSFLQFARSVCRRCERMVVGLSQKEEVEGKILIYFNRLSDLLFTMSRFVNFLQGEKETIWTK